MNKNLASSSSFAFDPESYLREKPFYLEWMYEAQYNLIGEWYAYAYSTTGDAARTQKNNQLALENFQQAKKLSQNPSYAYLLATILEATQQYDLAQQYYDEAAKKMPNDQRVQTARETMEQRIAFRRSITTTSSMKSYQSKYNFQLSYPAEWNIKDKTGTVTLQNPDRTFSIQIQRDDLGEQSAEQYLQRQTETYGTLINQGKARVPQFNPTLVKIWNDNGLQKMEFFLFNQKQVFKILVSPSDSQLMPFFDAILKSLTLHSDPRV